MNKNKITEAERVKARLALLRIEKVYEHNYSRKINKEGLNALKRHYQSILFN